MKKILLIFITLLCISFTSIAQVSNIVTGLTDPFDVVIEGSDAYIAEFAGNTISRVDLTAANPVAQDIITGINGPTSLLFDNDDVYISQVSGIITRRDASDLISNQTTIATGLTTPVSMVRFQNFLYFSEFQGARIGRIDLDNGNAVETVISGLNFPEQMVLIGEELFIAHAGANRLSKFNITDANPTLEDVVTDLNNPAGIVAVENNVFVTEFVNNGSIFRIDTQETNPNAIEVVASLNNPFGISFFEDNLYFVQNGAGTLSRFDGEILSVSDTKLVNSITVFPNPNNGTFSINISESDALTSVTVYDITGRIVTTMNPNQFINGISSVKLDVPNGMYFANFKTENNDITKKIIIR